MIKDQSIFSLVIILLILITISLDYVLILLGENWCWSLVGLKGLNYLAAAMTTLSIDTRSCRNITIDVKLLWPC